MAMHPIVAQLSPSGEQAPAVTARGSDLVVTAGAGTGKTRTLVARYLSLLAEGAELRSILAITFTRKAAREMRNRVRDEIRRFLESPDLDQAEENVWQNRYTALDAARIGTIHSFCSEVLRAHPAEAGIDPGFQTLEEGQAHVLQRRALDEALGWAADEPGAVGLFSLLGEGGLRSCLKVLMEARLDAGQAFDRLPADVPAHWQAVLRARQEQRLLTLISQQPWLEAVEVLQENVAHQPDDRVEVQRQATLAALESGLGHPGRSVVEKLDALSGLDDIDLRGGSHGAWPGGKEQLDCVKGALRNLRDMWKGQASLLELSLNTQDMALAGAIPGLRDLFTRALSAYDQLKDERQALDFDDLEQGALDLLHHHPAVRERWQGEFQAILVDEFQDTNARQRDLVALLNDGGKLFIVGDAKQSIYRFRGADVTVFRGERKRIERQGGRHLPLTVSYRAHSALIEAFDGLLRPLLGEVDDPCRPWAEPFAPLLPHRRQARSGFHAPHVELHLTAGSKSSGALDRAADALAWRIAELVEGSSGVGDKPGIRALGYGDFAILCRASTWFRAYEDALERAGVPFLTVAGRGFHDRPEIRDLLNALQSLADPTHDLALAGLLRSPAFALSDASLYRLCQAQREAGPRVPLWDMLARAPTVLAGEDDRRAARAHQIVGELAERVGRAAVADVLKEFLDETGYRAALLETGKVRAARNAAKLLADAHASGMVGVGEFLEYLTGLRDAGAREGEARSTAEGAVQIMSIHAAKGLEFPVVIIGDVTSGGGGRAGSFLIDDELGPVIKLKDDEDQTPAVYELARARSDDQEDAESDRLLYVAMTRAQDKLILSGCVGLKRDGTLGKPGGYLGKIAGADCLGLLGAEFAYEEEGAQARELALMAGSVPVACTLYEPHFAGGTRGTEREARGEEACPVPPPLLAPLPSFVEHVDERTAERERIPTQRVWRVVPSAKRPTADAWVIGTLLHEALAAWRFPVGRDAGFERWVEARARGYGITDAHQITDAARRTRKLLARFRSHALFQEMDGAEQRLHEVPYSLMDGDRVESGIIDALYRRNGVWRIVEFKSDRIADQTDLDRLLAELDYEAQAERYIRATRLLLGQQCRLVLCLLNFAGRVRVHEIALDPTSL